MKRKLNPMVVGLAVWVLAGWLGSLFAAQTMLRLVQPGTTSTGTNLTFRLQLQSSSNSVIYVLQSSSDLLSWRTVLSGKSLPGAAVQITDLAPTNRSMFFRVREYGKLVDTNPPTWTNGPATQFVLSPPSSVGLTWAPAIDDIGVAQYRLFVNGVLVTNVLASTLSYQFSVDYHQPTSIQIQAVDASGNSSAVFSLVYLPGDDVLAVSNDQGRIYAFYQLTNGTFSAPQQVGSFNVDRGVTLADFDRDGILDIVGGGASGNTLTPYFLKGKGDGTFAAPIALPPAQGANSYMMAATVGDFDGDGNLDFVCDGNERYVFFYWGNGDGTFTLEVKDWGCCGRGIAAGDFNEDGRDDLARGTTSDGKVRLFLSNGDRTFTETNQVGQFGSDPYGLVAGDFNEDGHLDLIENSSSGGDVVFYKGAGNGTFTPLGTNGPWANLKLNDYAGMSAFDYNGDGHLDMVMTTYGSQSVFLFPGKGDGTFGTNSQVLSKSIGNSLGISAPPRPPRADVNITPLDPATNLNGTIAYRAVGSSVAAGDYFRWSFGDQGTNLLAWSFGTNPPNMGPAVSHQYKNEGRFLTRLWHTDAQGIQSVRGTWATIKGKPPVANPGGPYLYGSEVATQAVWYATLNGSGSSDDFGIASYTWDFGDGTIVTTNVPTIFHGWTNSGVWKVSLTVMDAARQTDTKSTTVTFTNGVPPTAVINGLATVDETHALRGVWSTTFYATNSTDPYGIWKYSWNFGNGQTATGPIGPATYNAVGTNVVRLTVTGNDNQTNATSFIVVIKANGLPVPVINGPHVLPVTVSTNGLWFGAWDALSSTDDTGIYIYNWNFGDGITASGPQVTHNYTAQGVYPLQLTVTDNGNQSVSTTQNVVVVGGNPPVARITASTLTPEGAQPVTLSGASSTSDNGIYLYTWFLPPRQFNFAGQFLDPNQWLSTYTTQNGKLSVAGQNNWGVSYFFSVGTLLQRGGSIQGRIDTPSSSSAVHAMVGLKNLNTSSGQYGQYPYALYFANGDLHVYTYGNDAGKITNYNNGTSYDFRIETKPGSGARFYFRASGTGSAFNQVFETATGTDSIFSFGADVNAGVFGFENFLVDGVVAFGRDQIKPIYPGGTVTLQVVDSALVTNSTSVVISPVVGAPPTVVINGPTNGQTGIELSYTGYGSADDYGIASYSWVFGDGSPTAFGPAVSHSYGTAGTYTNTLTVMDYADQSATASLVVTVSGSNALVHVPWLIINGIEQPHEVYSGKTNTLKAVARAINAPFTNVWNFGDGTGSVTNYITNGAVVYNLEATHAYVAGVGTPFYAVATVYLTNGTVLQDTYPLVVQAKTLEVEEKVAIDEGLWNLQKLQNRYDLDANTHAGRWDSSGTISATASSVQAFAVNGHLMTDDPARDPYVDTVRRGINYLLSQLITINIGPQQYGDPDGNHNGIALQANTGQPIYETGPVLDALVAAGRPELIAPVGGANVKGRSFSDIVQDLVDMFCWGQSDDPVVGGGWRYGWNQAPDNSASQWGAIGMFPAERFWGSTVPDWVKARNMVWLAYSAGQTGFGYAGPGDGIATTPSALVQMGFDNISTTNGLWTHGENFLAANWAAGQNIIAQNNVYANYAIAKALRAAYPQAVHNLALTGKDWFNDPINGLARFTIDHQSPAGAWTSAAWVDAPLASAWSILILSSSLFQQGPVAVINVSPNPSAIGYPVIFDARGSYHKHPSYKIIEYRWVFDSSKGVDFNHPDAVGAVVTNVFGSLSTNTVYLQVRDNGTPQLSDSASVVVQTTIPPYPPTADAGGPYVALAGQDVHLDGSGSFTVDSATGNFIQSYDWEVNYQVPVTFNQGVSGPRPVLTNGYPTAGAYQIGLRVKNANSLVYTNFALPDMTSDAFTTVYVYNRVIPDLRVRTKGTKAQLTWTKVGDYAVVVRSQDGPDRGFTEVGRTDSSYATFLDTTIDYNNEYYYRVYAYQNGNPNALGLSDPIFAVSPPRNLDEHAPKFQSTPSRLAKVGQLYEVTLDAKDPENKPIFFSLLSGPTNLTVNPTSGLVDFTATPTQIGNQFLSFQVSNSIGRDVLSFTLFVFPATNHPPVVNINGPYASLIGQPIQFSSAGTMDPDNNPLRYYWNFGDGSTSTNINPVHTYGGVGDYLVSLFVNDGYGGTTSAQSHAQITRPNVPPVAVVSNGPNFTVRLGETLQLDGSGSYSPIGNPITYTWIWGDGTAGTNIASVVSHAYSAGGPYAGSLIVADNRGGLNAYNFNVTMAPATLPPVVSFTVSNNPAFAMDTVTFDATATVDPQGDPMTFRWDFGDHSRTTGPLVTHTFQQITNYNVVLTVSNSHGAFTISNQVVQVLDAPPVFVSSPPLMVRAGKPYNYAPVVTDLAGASVTFHLAQAPPTMSCDTNTGVLNWLPGTNNIGPNSVDLVATDANGGVTHQTFSVVVTTPLGPQIDLLPTHIEMSNVVVDAQSLALSGTVTVYFQNKGTDPIPVPFTVSVFVDKDLDGTFSTNADLVVGYGIVPKNFPAGATASIEMTVFGKTLFKDCPLYAFVDSQNVVAEYNELNNIQRSGFDADTNTPPVIDLSAASLDVNRSSMPTNAVLTARLGNSGLVAVPTNVPMSFYDGDPHAGGALIGVAHSTASLSPGTYQDLSVTWNLPPVTNHTIFVVADDPGTGVFVYPEISYSNNTFSTEENLAAILAPVADPGVGGSVALGDTVQLNGSASTDPQGRPLTYQWSFFSIPIGSRAQLSNAGTVSPSFKTDLAGDYNVQLVVNNGVLNSSNATITITGVDTNVYAPPKITSSPSFQAIVGVPYVYQIQAKDPQNGSLTYRLPQAPPGMTILTNSGLVQWTPTNSGSFLVQVTVDGRGGSYYQSYTLTVIPFTNLPPQFTSTPITTVAPTSNYTYTAVASSPMGYSISYSLAKNPSGMSINSSSGVVSWTPAANISGGSTVAVVANDGHGNTATQTYTLVVANSSANGPQVAPIPDQTVKSPATFATINLDNYVADTAFPASRITWKATGANALSVTIDSNRVATVIYSGSTNVAEQITFLASDPAGFSAYSSAVFTALVDSAPPIAAIANLDPNNTTSIIMGTFNLLGTADDPGAPVPVAYRIGLYDSTGAKVADETPAPVDAGGWHEGRVPAGGSLGKLDFTLVRNGSYNLLLEVQANGQVASANAQVAIDTPLKIGRITFYQQDLVLPVQGIGMQVVRTYDSYNGAAGDFGYSWTYSVSDLGLSVDDNRVQTQDEVDGTPFSLRVGGSWDVTLTMPDTGKRVTFRFSLLQGSFTAQAVWTPPAWVQASLVPTISPTLVTLPGLPPTWQAAGFETDWQAFDWPGFVLTLQDGTQYLINRQDQGEHFYATDSGNGGFVHAYTGGFLSRITQTTGEHTDFLRNGTDLRNIVQFNAANQQVKSILFQRDGTNRISAVYTPENLDTNGKPVGPASVAYTYDSQGNLATASKLMDASNPTNPIYATFKYSYSDPQFPHLLTEIDDPRGIPVLRAQFDSLGRLIGTLDAFGRLRSIQYNPGAQTQTVFDRLGNATQIGYDQHGNMISQTDPLGNTTTYTFDSNNRKTSMTDPLGHTTSLAYDSNGNLNQITDPLGHSISFAISASGNPLSYTDPLGHTVTNSFDEGGRPTSSTDPLGNVTKRNYDAAGNMTDLVDPSGHTTAHMSFTADGVASQISNVAGQALNLTYDASGHVTSHQSHWSNPANSNDVRAVTSYVGIDYAGRVTNRVDVLGNSSSQVFDQANNLTQSADSRGNIVSNSYDVDGNLIESRDSSGLVTRTVYDANDRPVLQVNPHLDGQTAEGTQFIYDAAGRLASILRLSNVVVSVTPGTVGGVSVLQSSFVSAGGILSSNYTTYDAAGRKVAFTDESGNTTRFEYDAADHKTAIIDPLGNRTTMAYDAAGHNTSIRDPLGNETDFVYDADGRLVRTVFPNGTSLGATYTSTGQPLTKTDPLGNVRQLLFDNLGVPTGTLLPQVPDPENANAMTNPVSMVVFDVNRNVQQLVDPKGRITAFTYDQFNRRTARTLPLGQVEQTAYNALGDVSRVTDFDGQAVEVQYDAHGRVIARNMYAAGANTPSESAALKYDAVGRVIEMDEPRGITRLSYDLEDRVVQIASPEGTINYAYDPATGRKTRTWTANSDASYAYDAMGRLQALTVVKRNGHVLTNPEVTTYTYTATGLRASATLPNGIRTLYNYDQNSRLVGLQHLGTNGTILMAFSYQYNSANLRTNALEIVTGSDGVFHTNSISYAYDALNRLTTESAKDLNDGSGYQAKYAYDLVGNRLRRSITTAAKTLTTYYAYDANDRLLMESNVVGAATSGGASFRPRIVAPDGRPIRMFDPVVAKLCYYTVKGLPYGLLAAFVLPGAFALLRRRRRIAVLTLDLNANRALLPRCVSGLLAASMLLIGFDGRVLGNQAVYYALLTTDTWGLDGSVTTYQYDANGSVVQKITTGPKAETDTFQYTILKQLALSTRSYSNGGSQVVETSRNVYSYDGVRVRSESSTTVNGVSQSSLTNLFLIDPANLTGFAQIIEELPAFGATPSTSYTMGIDIVAQSTDASGVGQFFLRDGHDSTRQLVSASGLVTDYYGFDGFGMMLGGNPTSSSPSSSKILYSGQYFDPSLGLYNLRARYYDPASGRFTTMDSNEGSPQDPQSLHKYGYCHDDPINYMDPSGHQDLAEVVVALGVLGTLVGIAIGGLHAAFGGSFAPDSAMFGISGSLSGNVNGALGTTVLNAFSVGIAAAQGSSIGHELVGDVVAGVGGALGQLGKTTGVGGTFNVGIERLFTTGDRQSSMWFYNGPGISFSSSLASSQLSGSITIYGGVCWNVPKHDKYAGPFISISLGAGSTIFGWSMSFFWSDGNFGQNGYNVGLTIAVPPNSPGPWSAGIGISYVTYHELFNDPWTDPGRYLALLFLVPGMQIWVPFLGYKYAFEKA